MTNVLGPISVFVLLTAGFVAYKNQQAYQREIDEATLQRQNLDRSKKRLQEAIDTLAATVAEREGVEAENVQLTKDEEAQREANETLKSQIAVKTQETEANKQRLDEIREKTARVGDIRELASKMRATNAELAELAETIESHEAKLDQLTTDNQQTETRIGSMQDMFDTIAQSKSLPSLNTRIRSIYPTWGFVTLSAGNDAGVVMSSMLDIVRDGTKIGQLLVTSVERNSAAASIVPDSVAEDITLMVGDRVVPTKENPPANPATAFIR